jgi:hypothetical protein
MLGIDNFIEGCSGIDKDWFEVDLYVFQDNGYDISDQDVKESLNETFYAVIEADGKEERIPFENRQQAKDYLEVVKQGKDPKFAGKKIGSTYTEALTEAVDKELDDKLKAHNEYIEYLKEMIEKEEKSLANAKNDFVKKSIQSRIDALKADLEAALPEALKGEVETELPTAEEIDLEATENTEEKEETKESLTEDEEVGVKSSGDPKITYKIKYSYRYTDEQAKGDEPRTEVKTVSAPSYEEAENDLYGSLINAKRPHEFTVLEVNGEKYDNYIKKLKKGTNAKDSAKNLKEAIQKNPDISAEEINKIVNDKTLSQKEKVEKIYEDVKIISDLSDYEPWSGAVDT